jgi:hypothetical protein
MTMAAAAVTTVSISAQSVLFSEDFESANFSSKG